MQATLLLVRASHNGCSDKQDPVNKGHSGDYHVVHKVAAKRYAPAQAASVGAYYFKTTGHFPEGCSPVSEHQDFIKQTENEGNQHKAAVEQSRWLSGRRRSQNVWHKQDHDDHRGNHEQQTGDEAGAEANADAGVLERRGHCGSARHDPAQKRRFASAANPVPGDRYQIRLSERLSALRTRENLLRWGLLCHWTRLLGDKFDPA